MNLALRDPSGQAAAEPSGFGTSAARRPRRSGGSLGQEGL